MDCSQLDVSFSCFFDFECLLKSTGLFALGTATPSLLLGFTAEKSPSQAAPRSVSSG